MNQSHDIRPFPRLVPDEPLPAYAFVPGKLPHPESDPAGHSYGRTRPRARPLEPDQWRANREYLCGLDLFNHGYYWESHVEFESLWAAAGRKGIIADFLKGLIHLAAAGVKHLEGRPDGVKSHAERAVELWRAIEGAGNGHLAGLKIETLIEIAKTLSDQGWPTTGVVLIPFDG